MRSFQKLADTDWSVVSAQRCSAPSIHYSNGRGLEVLRWSYIQGDDKCSLARVVMRGFLARSCLDHGLLGVKTAEGGGPAYPAPQRNRPQGAPGTLQAQTRAGPLTGGAVNNISPSFSELREAYKLNTVFVVCSWCTKLGTVESNYSH